MSIPVFIWLSYFLLKTPFKSNFIAKYSPLNTRRMMGRPELGDNWEAYSAADLTRWASVVSVVGLSD